MVDFLFALIELIR